MRQQDQIKQHEQSERTEEAKALRKERTRRIMMACGTIGAKMTKNPPKNENPFVLYPATSSHSPPGSKPLFLTQKLPHVEAVGQAAGSEQHAFAVFGALVGQVHGAQL